MCESSTRTRAAAPMAMELLLACARNRLGLQATVKQAPFTREQIDAQHFLKLAQRHRVIPMAHAALDSIHGVSASLKTSIGARCRRIALRNLQLTAELRRIAIAFADAGIACIALKGPSLALELYGEVNQRQFNDLDLLVRPADVVPAARILNDLGFRNSKYDVGQLIDYRSAQMLERFHETTLTSASATVDLHWRFHDDDRSFPTPIDALFSAPRACDVLGVPVATLPEDERVKYLAFHTVKHRCGRLSWLVDFAKAVNQLEQGRGASMIAALESRQRRIVVVALLMLDHLGLLGSLDAFVRNAPAQKRRHQRLIRTMERRLFHDSYNAAPGVIAEASWRCRLSGTAYPLLNCLYRSASPQPEDMLRPGWFAPYLCRWAYLASKGRATLLGS